MTDAALPGAPQAGGAAHPLPVRLALSRRFHRIAMRLPLVRRLMRDEGAALFEVVSGFVRSQALAALVELGVLDRLAQGAASAEVLAATTAVPGDRLAVLLRAGAALRLIRLRRGRWALTPRGAAFVTVPGLADMVRHHRALYRDLADPAGFFRDGSGTELAAFWPYVFGAAAAGDAAAARYSRLMADSQALVAEDTLRLVDLSDRQHLMDVGGGTGAFLRAVADRWPGLRLTLFDLPAVLAAAPPDPRLHRHPGSFRDDPLPAGADAVSLVRVLYDHPDAVVAALLARVRAALPPGGRLIVSEPMSGGDARPDPATDTYFAVYTLAMRTGRTRSPAEIGALLAAAGMAAIRPRPGPRPFVTAVIEARRP